MNGNILLGNPETLLIVAVRVKHTELFLLINTVDYFALFQTQFAKVARVSHFDAAVGPTLIIAFADAAYTST